MAGFYRAMFPAFDLARYFELEKRFEVDHTKPLRKLSRGMRAQAAIWLALSIRADVLLLDEPMDGIDPLARRRMWRLVLEEVAERGLTVLVTSHNLRELEGVCDHLGIMAKGTMREEIDLSQPLESVAKVQVVLPEGASLPAGFNVIKKSNEGHRAPSPVVGLFLDTCQRYAYLGVGYLIVWLFWLVGLALRIAGYTPPADPAQELAQSGVGVLVLSVAVSFAAENGAFSWIFDRRAVQLYGMLPVRREAVFLAVALAGVIPLLVAVGISGFVFAAILPWMARHALLIVAFGGISALCL